jgi:hypothetical protein
VSVVCYLVCLEVDRKEGETVTEPAASERGAQEEEEEEEEEVKEEE